MHAAVRAEGLLAPSSARFSVDKRCRLRKGLGSLLSYPLLVATLCFNPAKLKALRRPADQLSAVAATGMYTHLHWIFAATLSIGGGPPNVDFTLTLRLVRIRVSMMVLVFVFSVWIRRLRHIFPLSQVELCLAVRERWLTAANFDHRSHCAGTMSIFFTFAEHVSFEHSTGSPWPVIDSGREGNNNKQTYKTQKFLHTRSSIRQSASPCSCLCSGAPRPVRDLALAPRLSVATESTGTVLTPSQMSEIAGHGIQIQTSTSPIAEAPPAAHDARTSACSGLPLNRSCSMQNCHVIYWAVWRPFCWVERRCCLAPADQVSNDSTTKTTSDKNMFRAEKEEGHLMRAYGKDGVKRYANFDAPCGGFDSFSSLGLFFFGNNVLWTTV